MSAKNLHFDRKFCFIFQLDCRERWCAICRVQNINHGLFIDLARIYNGIYTLCRLENRFNCFKLIKLRADEGFFKIKDWKTYCTWLPTNYAVLRNQPFLLIIHSRTSCTSIPLNKSLLISNSRIIFQRNHSHRDLLCLFSCGWWRRRVWKLNTIES